MFSNIHLIGLGGTGANLIQTLLESDRLQNLLKSEDFNIACLAIDVADGDLNNLQNTYKATLEKLASKGIPVDKLWVRALNIKFNTPDSLFEFMEKYDKYVEKEGIQIKNYKPWLKSSISIPPLAGGVGRQRALSKAVYNQNPANSRRPLRIRRWNRQWNGPRLRSPSQVQAWFICAHYWDDDTSKHR